MVLAGSLLYMSDAIASETEISEAIVGIINDYAGNEPRVIEDSKRTHPNKMGFVDSCLFYQDHKRIKALKPEDYIYSHIDLPDKNLPNICVSNVYRSLLSPGPTGYFTHALNPHNRRASWDTENNRYHSWGLFFAKIKQEQRTRKNQDHFGSPIVPNGSSASFFPKQRMLIVASENAVITYKTTNQSYEAIDNGLNPKIAAEKQKSRNLRNFLIAGTVVGLAAHNPVLTGKIALATAISFFC